MNRKAWKAAQQCGLDRKPISKTAITKMKRLRAMHMAKPTKAEQAFEHVVSLLRRCYHLRFQAQPIVYISDEIAFIVDYYVQGFFLGIEIDGGSHDSNNAKLRDIWRTDAISHRQGWDILRFTNEQIFQRPREVCEIIIAVLMARTQAQPGQREELMKRLERQPLETVFCCPLERSDWIRQWPVPPRKSKARPTKRRAMASGR